MNTIENLPPGAIVIDDERAAMLNSFPLGSIIFDDERVADMKALPSLTHFRETPESPMSDFPFQHFHTRKIKHG